MALRASESEADETSVNRMWDLKVERANHMKNLGTIYREKEIIRLKSEKDQLKRIRQLDEYQKSKQSSSNHRNKSLQDRINYQNAILRNKILGALQDRKKSHSIARVERPTLYSPFRVAQEEEMYKTNIRLGQRLSKMESELKVKYNFKEHERMAEQYSLMIQKKSPKKKAYMKALTSKRVKGLGLISDFDDLSGLDY